MPRDTRTISIFLASPTDVSPERDLVAQVIDEWNQISGRSRSIHFELLRWERNVSAGFGEDGQEVVTRQIGDDYDAMIALFWTRVGTETPRAESGSIEEYERALTRRQSGEPVEIAFLFKEAPVSLKNIDFAQVQALAALKERLEAEGALYKEFTDDTVLRFEVNLLLDRLARDFAAPSARRSNAITDTPSEVAAPDLGDLEAADARNEEIGFLDVSESLERHSERSQEFLAEMRSHLEKMGAISRGVTSEMEELAKLGNVQPSVMRPLITRVTDGMNDFSEFLESQLPEYSQHSLGIAEDTRALIDLSRDFERRDGDISELEANLETLLSSMSENYESMQGYLESTENLQRMTVAFNHARKRLVTNLKAYLSDLSSTRNVVEKALEELRQLPHDR